MGEDPRDFPPPASNQRLHEAWSGGKGGGGCLWGGGYGCPPNHAPPPNSPSLISSQLFHTEPTQTMGSPSSPRNRLCVEGGVRGARRPPKRGHRVGHEVSVGAAWGSSPSPPLPTDLVHAGQHSEHMARQRLPGLREDVAAQRVPSPGTWGENGGRSPP